jgi:hypothetical protein
MPAHDHGIAFLHNRKIVQLMAGFGHDRDIICNDSVYGSIIRLFLLLLVGRPIPFMENYAIMA